MTHSEKLHASKLDPRLRSQISDVTYAHPGEYSVRQIMLTTKRKPAGVGEILIEEFMAPMGLTQGALAEAMGVQRKHVNDRRKVTAPTALL
jgi:hypothetical protein